MATPQGVRFCAAIQFVSGLRFRRARFFSCLQDGRRSALGLTITANVCALSTTMPDPSKAVVAAIASFALAAMSADIVHFYFLTDLQDFIRLATAIAPTIIFGCLLSVNPEDRRHRSDDQHHFLFLVGAVQPSNRSPALSFLFSNACL